ncbi:MAG: DUF5668 domain-containing protein [Lachnospiraceae bacterium]|nr:DUF5668 domain-containing protein [Lachnospiraceae bacterium]
MTNNTIRIRRVGTVTAGLALIAVGIVYLIKITFPVVELVTLMKFWPFFLIVLGIEILVEHIRAGSSDSVKFVYDFPAIFMMFMTLGFSMALALGYFVINNKEIIF